MTRRAAAVAFALAIAVGGCAAHDDGRIALTPEQASDAYRTAMCRVIETDGELDAALLGDDMDAIFDVARTRAEMLSIRNLTVSEQHVWPRDAEAVWQVDEALGHELSWVLEIADASSRADARAVPRPDPERRATADLEVRTALGLPVADGELCG